jgi:hypothetical protein
MQVMFGYSNTIMVMFQLFGMHAAALRDLVSFANATNARISNEQHGFGIWAGAYPRQLFSSTKAVSDTKNFLNTPYYPLLPPNLLPIQPPNAPPTPQKALTLS